MPANTGAGFVLAVLSTAFGFAMVWYMWWLAIASFIGIVGFTIYHTFNYERDFHLPCGRSRPRRGRAHADAGNGGAELIEWDTH